MVEQKVENFTWGQRTFSHSWLFPFVNGWNERALIPRANFILTKEDSSMANHVFTSINSFQRQWSWGSVGLIRFFDQIENDEFIVENILSHPESSK